MNEIQQELPLENLEQKEPEQQKTKVWLNPRPSFSANKVYPEIVERLMDCFDRMNRAERRFFINQLKIQKKWLDLNFPLGVTDKTL